MASHKNERGVSVPTPGAKQSFPPRGYQEDLIEIAKENNVRGSSRSVDGCISAVARPPHARLLRSVQRLFAYCLLSAPS